MKRRRARRLGVLTLIVPIALAGCGGSDSVPPFAVSEAQVNAECLTGTFVPGEPGFNLTRKRPPAAWRTIEAAPKAMQAERGAVLVTLRPRGTVGKVTLTKVTFEVDNLGLRPGGTVFYKPCKRRLKGAVIEGDLDRAGNIGESSEALDGTLSKGLLVGKDARPVSFPWTVSLKRPLRLYLVAKAYITWAKWAVRIAWESGSTHGVVHIDNGGQRYEIVDGQGSEWYRPTHGGWVSQGSSRWIGVR